MQQEDHPHETDMVDTLFCRAFVAYADPSGLSLVPSERVFTQQEFRHRAAKQASSQQSQRRGSYADLQRTRHTANRRDLLRPRDRCPVPTNQRRGASDHTVYLIAGVQLEYDLAVRDTLLVYFSPASESTLSFQISFQAGDL